MSRHVFLTQFEAASSLDSFDPGVKGTIFESVDVPVALASSWQLLYFLNFVLVALNMWLSTTVWFNNRFWQQTILSFTDNFLFFGIVFCWPLVQKSRTIHLVTRCGTRWHESPFPTVWRTSTSKVVGSPCTFHVHFHLTLCEVGYSFPLCKAVNADFPTVH